MQKRKRKNIRGIKSRKWAFKTRISQKQQILKTCKSVKRKGCDIYWRKAKRVQIKRIIALKRNWVKIKSCKTIDREK